MSELPRYGIPRIEKLRDKIATHPSLTEFIGPPMRGDKFDNFVNAFQAQLPKAIDRDVISKSLQHIAGVGLNASRLYFEAWRMIGNTDHLKKGMVVGPWTRQEFDEWVPMQVIHHVPKRSIKGDVGAVFTFRILAGTPCGLIATNFWTYSFCKFASSVFGFSKPWGNTPISQPSELMGLRLFGFIERDLSKTTPKFNNIKECAAFLAFNKKIIRKRARINFDCPRKFNHECYKCFVGLEDCAIAVHNKTYTKSSCSNCHKENVFFDPDNKVQMCVSCFQTQALARKKW